jgi:CheY-like chemotaxis protein
MRSARVATILLVEDNPDHAEFALKALKTEGVTTQVTWAKDGEEALEILERGPLPELILLDINMPKISGHEVLRHVKGDESLRAIPVIMLTTSDSSEDVAASYAAGANSYVAKRGGFRALVDQVKAVQEYWFGTCALPAAERPAR